MSSEEVVVEQLLHRIEETDSFTDLCAIVDEIATAKISGGHQKLMDAFRVAFDRILNGYHKVFNDVLRSALGFALSSLGPEDFGDIVPGCRFVDKTGKPWNVETVSQVKPKQGPPVIHFHLLCLADNSEMELYYLEASRTLVTDPDTKKVAENFYKNPGTSSVFDGQVIFLNKK